MSHSEGLEQVLADVTQERFRQHVKFGDQTGHPDAIWNAILGEEVGEASEALLNVTFPGAHREHDPLPELRRELIQVAAVAVAWVQAIDKRGHIGALPAFRIQDNPAYIPPPGPNDSQTMPAVKEVRRG